MEVIDRSRLAPVPPDVARRAAALGVRVAPRVLPRDHERRVNLGARGGFDVRVEPLEEVRVRARGALQETPLGAPDVAQSRRPGRRRRMTSPGAGAVPVGAASGLVIFFMRRWMLVLREVVCWVRAPASVGVRFSLAGVVAGGVVDRVARREPRGGGVLPS